MHLVYQALLLLSVVGWLSTVGHIGNSTREFLLNFLCVLGVIGGAAMLQ